MPEETIPFNEFNETARLLEIALKYTRGDMDKARLMVSGQYEDAEVLKGRFALDEAGIYGIFFMFLNKANRYPMNINTLLSRDRSLYEKTRIFDGWKAYYAEFGRLIEDKRGDNMDSYDFTSYVVNSLEGSEIFGDLENENYTGITESIKMIISRFFKEERVQCQIEPERVSSLTLEQEKIPLSLPPEEGAVKEDPEQVKEDDRLARIEEGADLVLEGRVIVSPIRGRNIREIKPGERIMVRLLNRDETTLNIARTLKAVNDKGDILPIVAGLKEKLFLEEGGYVLYGLVAKNVLVRIIEEEDLKIEMDAVRKEEDTPGGESRLLLYLALLAGLLMLTLILLLAIL